MRGTQGQPSAENDLDSEAFGLAADACFANCSISVWSYIPSRVAKFFQIGFFHHAGGRRADSSSLWSTWMDSFTNLSTSYGFCNQTKCVCCGCHQPAGTTSQKNPNPDILCQQAKSCIQKSPSSLLQSCPRVPTNCAITKSIFHKFEHYLKKPTLPPHAYVCSR